MRIRAFFVLKGKIVRLIRKVSKTLRIFFYQFVLVFVTPASKQPLNMYDRPSEQVNYESFNWAYRKRTFGT